MEEGLVDIDLVFVTNHQSPKLPTQADAAFHLPASFISPPFSSILPRRLFPVGFGQIKSMPLNTAVTAPTLSPNHATVRSDECT
jgi:hypothetical protein